MSTVQAPSGEWQQNEVVAADIGDTTAKTWVGEMSSDVKYDEEYYQHQAQVQQDACYGALTSFTTTTTTTTTATATDVVL